jgi:hypothetical protein
MNLAVQFDMKKYMKIKKKYGHIHCRRSSNNPANKRPINETGKPAKRPSCLN